jgi:hypothetical protein
VVGRMSQIKIAVLDAGWYSYEPIGKPAEPKGSLAMRAQYFVCSTGDTDPPH